MAEPEPAPRGALVTKADDRGCRPAAADGVERLLRDPKVVVAGGFIVFLIVLALAAPLVAPHGSAGAGPDARDRAAGRLCRGRARLSARHRRARPRRAFAPHLRHAGRAYRRLRRRRARLPHRLAARPARRLSRRLGRRADLAPGRYLDGVSAGAALDPAGRGARHRRCTR